MKLPPIHELRRMFVYEPASGVLIRLPSKTGRNAGPVLGNKTFDGHLRIKVGCTGVLVHRLVWALHNGDWPQGQIDHIDGDKTNNKISNLRDVPGYINAQNVRGPRRDNKSGLMGVHRVWQCGTYGWKAQIQVRGKKIRLGFFLDANEAHKAYLSAKRQLHEGCTI